MKCKYCGGTKFYEGPSGGLATNVLCANPKCRHWFNYLPEPIDRLDDLNRVEPGGAGIERVGPENWFWKFSRWVWTKRDVPWWRFWDPQSGGLGGLIIGFVLALILFFVVLFAV